MARLIVVVSAALATSPSHAQEPEPTAPVDPPSEAPEPEVEPAPTAPADPPADPPTPADSTEPEPSDAPATSDEATEAEVTDPRVLEEQRAADAQAEHENNQPREPLADVELPDTPPWRRHLEIGASFAFLVRPFATALGDTNTNYAPAPGFGVHMHWPIFDWLRLNPYFVHAFHSVDIPQGALQSGTSESISANATISDESVATFILGAKIAPTLQFSDRWRGWIAVGIGWGRFEFPVMTVTEADGSVFEIRERSGVVVEFPMGLGVQFDVIERWLAIHYEATAAPITGQTGAAHEVFQSVDADGNIRDVGPFGAIEASFVQTLGISLIL